MSRPDLIERQQSYRNLARQLLATFVLSSTLANPLAGQSLGDAAFVWDNFSYQSGADIVRENPWCMGVPGYWPDTEVGCRFEDHKAWYETNWAESGRLEPQAMTTRSIGSQRVVQLKLSADSVYAWGRIPVIVSGFTRRTGTWYARLRLQDFSGWSPGTSTSFWTQSPYWACANPAPRASCTAADEKYWSEWNFEWTTIWTVRRGTPGPWMSTGAVSDGEGGAIGGSIMGAQNNTADFTCTDPSGRSIYEWSTCRNYLINGREASTDDGPFVDAMVRFDGHRVRWELRAHANGRDLPHRWVALQSESPFLGPGQPVMTIFSITPRMGERVQTGRWYLADWFIYSEKTDLSLDELIAAATELDESGIRRISTLPTPLERPRRSTGIHLETRGDGLDAGEFLVLPPQNYNTYYDLFWSYRVADDTDSRGWPIYSDGWRSVPDHSFRVMIEPTTRHRYAQVSVRYRLHTDEHGIHVGPISIPRSDRACVETRDFGRTFVACP